MATNNRKETLVPKDIGELEYIDFLSMSNAYYMTDEDREELMDRKPDVRYWLKHDIGYFYVERN